MSKPNEGFDLDSYDFTEYASALDGENLSRHKQKIQNNTK
jgi:hypothetical protein